MNENLCKIEYADYKREATKSKFLKLLSNIVLKTGLFVIVILAVPAVITGIMIYGIWTAVDGFTAFLDRKGDELYYGK